VLDRLPRSRVVRSSGLEEVEDALGARRRPEREQVMVRVGEGPAAADRHEAGIPHRRKDHAAVPSSPGQCAQVSVADGSRASRVSLDAVVHDRRSSRPASDTVPAMPKRVMPFLMFQGGVAERAMSFYTSLFDDGRVLEISRYGPEGPGPEGTVQVARFALAGQELMCSDSFVTHDFSFTPSFSVWIETESEEELERLFAALSDQGTQLMPLGDYGFSRRFGWVNDRYGVSWQLNLA
jgi:predicted 3-demethylubiquinone-9 3-methyltransferase (glyoxalase superfamily)